MKVGITILIGMLVVSFLCVRRWEKGWVYRHLPPIYGLIVGIVLALSWRTPTTTVISSLEIVAGFALAGWILWFAVWIEMRRGG
jgi:hypothetical protein